MIFFWSIVLYLTAGHVLAYIHMVKHPEQVNRKNIDLELTAYFFIWLPVMVYKGIRGYELV